MGRDALELEAYKLWEEAELRVLSSPWTSPSRFGDHKEYYIKKVLDKRARK